MEKGNEQFASEIEKKLPSFLPYHSNLLRYWYKNLWYKWEMLDSDELKNM